MENLGFISNVRNKLGNFEPRRAQSPELPIYISLSICFVARYSPAIQLAPDALAEAHSNLVIVKE